MHQQKWRQDSQQGIFCFLQDSSHCYDNSYWLVMQYCKMILYPRAPAGIDHLRPLREYETCVFCEVANNNHLFVVAAIKVNKWPNVQHKSWLVCIMETAPRYHYPSATMSASCDVTFKYLRSVIDSIATVKPFTAWQQKDCFFVKWSEVY